MLSIRKIGAIGRTYRHLNRYRQILTILFKYGFGNIVELLKIDQYIESGRQLISRKPRERIEKFSRAMRVRMAIEELGPTYIKLGQILSTRPDLVPADFIQELARLQDEVPPFPLDDAKQIIVTELGRPLDDVFESFDDTLLASASIGQVYRAVLKDKQEVAVKVQRPEIRKTIEIDLEIMLYLATLMERHIKEMALHRPVKIVEEFARTLEKEIDFAIEASNMDRISAQFVDDETVYIPKVKNDLTTPKVLTAEYVEGIKISDVEEIEKTGLDRKLIVSRGANIYLKQIFDSGFFHADPHPGNIFVLPDNVICLLDFGMTGMVDRPTRENFVELIDGIVQQDTSGVTRALLKLTIWEKEPDVRALEKDVADFIGLHLYKLLKDIEISRLLQSLLELVARHRLRIPPDIFLMMKALGTVEGVARTLDPEFDMIAQAAPFIARVKLERFTPQRIAEDAVRLAIDLRHFLQEFPKDLLEITRLFREQKLPLRIEHRGLEAMRSTQDQTSNRISFSIIIAALIIGSALIVISNIPPLFYGISIIGIIGFLAAAILGIWLLVAILKKGRL